MPNTEQIFGRNPVYEVVRAGRRRVHKLLVAEGVRRKGNLARAVRLAGERGIPVLQVRRSTLDHDSNSHQGLAAVVDPYPYVSLEDVLARAGERGEPPLVLLLDMLQNPQNLGALLRTAEAVGVHGVVIPEHRGVGVTNAVVNASAGASEHLYIAVSNISRAIEYFKQRDLWIVGLESAGTARGPGELDLRGPLGLVVGNEGEGMRRLVQQSCDFLLRLPQRGQIDSLNAAVAGSVALYLVWQARGYAGHEGMALPPGSRSQSIDDSPES
ncbi:MAG: 23S rRNA (guanosine(2251)-2'-O)-methyltransferase RlmB [Chloroflexi bacterium]|nr:23S rRNA (guanosine(2251)-2'-O)-methyltransferase RlmB [Chloroflexota bacterium]